MKKKILLVLILCLSVAASVGIYFQSRDAAARVWISLPDRQGNWRQIRTNIPPLPDPENLAKAMQYLHRGMERQGLPPVFPPEVDYYSISVQDGYAVEINFRNGYLKMPELQRGLCETAMIRTFMTFPEIRKLYLYEEGIPLPTVGKSSVFGMVATDAYLSFEESLSEEIVEKETLYFFNAAKRKLVPEKKSVSRNAYESKGKAILTALMKGTDTEGLSTLLTESVRINDVKIRNQVCYVDFSQDFVKEYTDMGANRRLMIYAIVNTLADLEDVEYVQFLINGENPEKYSETDNIKTLFRRNHVYVE